MMPVSHPVGTRRGIAQAMVGILLLGILVLMSACGGDAGMQQRAKKSQDHLDLLLKNAQQMGVPVTALQAVIKQEQQLQGSVAPFNLFSDQPANDYYQRLDTRYSQLAAQVEQIVTDSTKQARTKAQQDLKNLQSALDQAQQQGLPTDSFTSQVEHMQALQNQAKTPKDYLFVSTSAHNVTQVLNQLQTLKNIIGLLQSAHLDVTALNTYYQSDMQMVAHITSLQDIQHLSGLLNTHYQEAQTNLLQVMPNVTHLKLNELNTQIQQLAKYNVDPAPYRSKLAADRALVGPHMNIMDYQTFTSRIDADIAAVQVAQQRGNAQQLLQQFHKEADSWGNAHLYQDNFNNISYTLDTGYQTQGIGSDLDAEFQQAQTVDDYQNLINKINDAAFNLSMLEADYNDTTAYDQMHSTDQKLLQHYNLQSGQVVMVSLVEQALRVYQDGQLVKAFEVTTGRPELPSLPGMWSVMGRLSPTIFRSGEPKGSPYWYPDTPIHYAILYHSGGYYIHDSWWRDTYGPGTQFPHADSSGNQSFAGDGSHGCINMQEDEAAWVYNNTGWNTTILIY